MPLHLCPCCMNGEKPTVGSVSDLDSTLNTSEIENNIIKRNKRKELKQKAKQYKIMAEN